MGRENGVVAAIRDLQRQIEVLQAAKLALERLSVKSGHRTVAKRAEKVEKTA